MTFKNKNIVGRIDALIVNMTVNSLFFVKLSTMWWKWLRSPLKGWVLFKILTINNLNMSIAGIIRIIKTSSPKKKLSKLLYW